MSRPRGTVNRAALGVVGLLRLLTGSWLAAYWFLTAEAEQTVAPHEVCARVRLSAASDRMPYVR
ncbi:hypothetical protein [Streptomyces canus]|uniref:hypothetical protein n=1 Tax=Streptomyces canus TaxID=58343 RepID=UPI00037304ED|nr:hypothetical protein [Streptomyces canus]